MVKDRSSHTFKGLDRGEGERDIQVVKSVATRGRSASEVQAREEHYYRGSAGAIRIHL